MEVVLPRNPLLFIVHPLDPTIFVVRTDDPIDVGDTLLPRPFDGSYSVRYWIQPAGTGDSSGLSVCLSTDRIGQEPVAPTTIVLLKELVVVSSYPARPMLVDPGAQSIAPITNPTAHRTYSISDQRYQGSVIFEVVDNDDVSKAEAFVDALSDPDAWFELEVPDRLQHIGPAVVFESETDWDGWIVLVNETGTDVSSLDSKVGWFGRVGRRTVRVVEWNTRTITIPVEGSNENRLHDLIKIEPRSMVDVLRNMTTPAFDLRRSIRVRPTSVTSEGDADFGAGSWRVDWVETDG